MNILISIDSNYIIPVKVMLKSLSLSIKSNFKVFLLYSKLKEKEVDDLDDFCQNKCNAEMQAIYIDCKQMFGGGGLHLPGWFSEEIYFRLIAPFVLPDSIERILWIDADAIVKKSLFELYNSDMKEKSISVVRDMGDKGLVDSCAKRLQLNKKSIYFNSGVILFNLSAIRKRWIKDSFISYIKAIPQNKLAYPDQDILNIIFEYDRNIVSDIYNYQIRSWSDFREDEIEKAAVIHYVGKVKPWNEEYGNKVKELWWDILRRCGRGNSYYVLCLKNRYYRLKKRIGRIVNWKEKMEKRKRQRGSHFAK